MTPLYPLQMRWEGDVMRPLNPRAADRQYVVGQVYNLDHREDRSDATHRHEFAWLHEAWLNLPEQLADAFPTSEHLRKRALIQAGYCDETLIDVGSKVGAMRVAAEFRKVDDFALVIVRGPVVVIRRAKSQSRRAMDSKTFQASKTAILEVVAGMIGVSPDDLSREVA
jgi:hypothetical protein